MLKRIVPTEEKMLPGTGVFAFIARTSRSVRLEVTRPFQLQPAESTQAEPTRFTMMPVGGAAAPAALVAGPGTPAPTPPVPQALAKPPRPTTWSTAWLMPVVRLPEWNAAT